MKLLGVDHIDLLVSDVAQAVAFYKKLGLVVQGALDGGKTVFLWNGDEAQSLVVELHQTEPGQSPGIGHIAFLVEDVPQAHREAAAAGVEFGYGPLHQPLSGRDIAGFDGPDGLGLQVARKTGRGEFEANA